MHTPTEAREPSSLHNASYNLQNTMEVSGVEIAYLATDKTKKKILQSR